MNKFFVLNQNNSLMSPLVHGFKQPQPDIHYSNSNNTTINALPEDEAKKFAEKLATLYVGQTFYLVELKGTATAKPPVIWATDDADQPLVDPEA